MKPRALSLVCALTVALLGICTSPSGLRPKAMYQPTALEPANRALFELPTNLPAVEAIYPLSDAAKARLRLSGFVVLPEQNVERLSGAYMRLFSEDQVAVLITTDVALHLFHNVFDDLLAQVEREHLMTDVALLVEELQGLSITQYETLPETQPLVKSAARHNVVFLSVAARLLNNGLAVPADVRTKVEHYVDRVLEHAAVEYYPGDDYTQYEPRGHYDGDEALERYFRAVKWLSRRIFRIEDYYHPADADVELVAAALLAQLLAGSPSVQVLWQKVYDITRELAGPADSITPRLLQQALDRVFGLSFDIGLLEEPANRAALRSELLTDAYPTSEIIPVPTEFAGQVPLKYVQLLGERYLPDADAMQATTFPDVAGRCLPSGLDVMATVLGSQRAERWLADEMIAYPGLAEQLAALRAQFTDYTEQQWTKSVYNGWLYSIRPLLAPMPLGAPACMQSLEWQDKQLNTAMASWTQLRHDFILYGKQTYVPAPWAWGPGLVEPVPETYRRLGDLCMQAHDVLQRQAVLPVAHASSLLSLSSQFRTWAGYARKVAEGSWLSQEEQDDIHRVGTWFLSFFAEQHGVAEKPAMLVADVASDSLSGRVLHEGTGHFNPIVITYTPPGGEPTAGIGYVLSHYEFIEPSWNRLSDDEWEVRLQQLPPPRPPWSASFLPIEHAVRIYLPWVRQGR